jgi:hypothetical protein
VATADLPVDPTDQFDRLLLAVATVDRLLLLTADRWLAALHAENPRLPIRVA